jgi:hypothetical protein
MATIEEALRNNMDWAIKETYTDRWGETSDPYYFGTVRRPQTQGNVIAHCLRYQEMRRQFKAQGYKGLEKLDEIMARFTENVTSIGMTSLPLIEIREQMEAKAA